MEYPEIEIMPGVYITDYRKKQNSVESEGVLKPNSEDYRRELIEKGLNDPNYLDSERHRFERAITMLQDTNKELALENDPEFTEFINENLTVISKYQDFIKVLDSLLGESGSLYL